MLSFGSRTELDHHKREGWLDLMTNTSLTMENIHSKRKTKKVSVSIQEKRFCGGQNNANGGQSYMTVQLNSNSDQTPRTQVFLRSSRDEAGSDCHWHCPCQWRLSTKLMVRLTILYSKHDDLHPFELVTFWMIHTRNMHHQLNLSHFFFFILPFFPLLTLFFLLVS